MRYSIKVYGLWNCDYDGNVDSTCNTMHLDEYADMVEGKFVSTLRDVLDVSAYEPTLSNIRKEYEPLASKKLDDACAKRILKYYKFRTELFNKICGKLTCGQAERILNDFGSNEIAFRWNLPSYANTFSCSDPAYDGGMKDAWIEIGICK